MRSNERKRRTRVEIPSSGLILEGRWTTAEGSAPRSGVVICHPHPQFGGSMDNNVVAALEEYLPGRGIGALAFNFRGVGRSQGCYDQMRGEVDDVIAALMFLCRQPGIDAARLAVAGYSFGGLMAALAAARIEEKTALPTNGEHFRLGPAVLISPMSPAERWERADSLQPFYNRSAPVLIITGTADPFCPVASAKTLAHQIGMNASLCFLEGADHFYLGREEEAAHATAEFLGRTLT